MDISEIFFGLIATVWIIFFLRIPMINWRTIQYIKHKYPSEWEKEFQSRIGTSIFGGQTIFSLFSSFNDEKLEQYKLQWHSSLKQLLIVIVISVALVIVYIVKAELSR